MPPNDSKKVMQDPLRPPLPPRPLLTPFIGISRYFCANVFKYGKVYPVEMISSRSTNVFKYGKVYPVENDIQ